MNSRILFSWLEITAEKQYKMMCSVNPVNPYEYGCTQLHPSSSEPLQSLAYEQQTEKTKTNNSGPDHTTQAFLTLYVRIALVHCKSIHVQSCISDTSGPKGRDAAAREGR